MNQINMFEYCPSLLPKSKAIDITDQQLQKVYDSLYGIKKFRRQIEACNIKAVIEGMSFYTEHGSLGVGIGWSEKNPTILNLDKRGIEFDHNGKFYRFQDIAMELIKKYGPLNSGL